MEERAGVIGLGQIGAGVAICLARTQQLAAVYDIRADAADMLPKATHASLIYNNLLSVLSK